MSRFVHVVNPRRGDQPLLKARWCSSFTCRLLGMMFRISASPGEGLVLVQPRESRWDAAIHMLFVAFPLGVVWLDGEGVVRGTVLAQPWHFYLPPAPARYVVESTPDLLECVRLGDRIVFRDA